MKLQQNSTLGIQKFFFKPLEISRQLEENVNMTKRQINFIVRQC